MAVVTQVSEKLKNPHIRPINARRDLANVADLIELCFAETLDADGKRYLRRMRQASQGGRNSWFDPSALHMSVTAEGYIWEEDGTIIGNISLIPFSSFGRPIYLIANVAVHPDFRRQGIARALTDAALDWTRKRRIRSVWLQVRDDNLPAFRLYETTGFVERARRTTWTVLPDNLRGMTPAGIRIVDQKPRHWKHQNNWLRRNYPDNLFWYWALRRSAFRPGLLSQIANFFTETYIRHWGVEQHGRLLGMLSWKTTRTYADQLWLAAPPEHEDLVLQALLPYIHWREHSRRPLSMDMPTGRATNTLLEAGFHSTHTLVWMEIENNG
jgi:GNAT superfamily N-acetyltransferase